MPNYKGLDCLFSGVGLKTIREYANSIIAQRASKKMNTDLDSVYAAHFAGIMPKENFEKIYNQIAPGGKQSNIKGDVKKQVTRAIDTTKFSIAQALFTSKNQGQPVGYDRKGAIREMVSSTVGSYRNARESNEELFKAIEKFSNDLLKEDGKLSSEDFASLVDKYTHTGSEEVSDIIDKMKSSIIDLELIGNGSLKKAEDEIAKKHPKIFTTVKSDNGRDIRVINSSEFAKVFPTKEDIEKAITEIKDPLLKSAVAKMLKEQTAYKISKAKVAKLNSLLNNNKTTSAKNKQNAAIKRIADIIYETELNGTISENNRQELYKALPSLAYTSEKSIKIREEIVEKIAEAAGIKNNLKLSQQQKEPLLRAIAFQVKTLEKTMLLANAGNVGAIADNFEAVIDIFKIIRISRAFAYLEDAVANLENRVGFGLKLDTSNYQDTKGKGKRISTSEVIDMIRGKDYNRNLTILGKASNRARQLRGYMDNKTAMNTYLNSISTAAAKFVATNDIALNGLARKLKSINGDKDVFVINAKESFKISDLLKAPIKEREKIIKNLLNYENVDDLIRNNNPMKEYMEVAEKEVFDATEMIFKGGLTATQKKILQIEVAMKYMLDESYNTANSMASKITGAVTREETIEGDGTLYNISNIANISSDVLSGLYLKGANYVTTKIGGLEKAYNFIKEQNDILATDKAKLLLETDPIKKAEILAKIDEEEAELKKLDRRYARAKIVSSFLNTTTHFIKSASRWKARAINQSLLVINPLKYAAGKREIAKYAKLYASRQNNIEQAEAANEKMAELLALNEVDRLEMIAQGKSMIAGTVGMAFIGFLNANECEGEKGSAEYLKCIAKQSVSFMEDFKGTTKMLPSVYSMLTLAKKYFEMEDSGSDENKGLELAYTAIGSYLKASTYGSRTTTGEIANALLKKKNVSDKVKDVLISFDPSPANSVYMDYIELYALSKYMVNTIKQNPEEAKQVMEEYLSGKKDTKYKKAITAGAEMTVDKAGELFDKVKEIIKNENK
jgi:hypothetical protein